MDAGSFKFITTPGEAFLCVRITKELDGKLALRNTADQPDEIRSTIEEEFNYIVEANLFTGVITLTQTENLADRLSD